MEVNSQPPEKPHYTADGRLAVHSIWRTIQGEGPDAGTPAVFIRLAGCNLACPACDTDYTSKRNESVFPDEILRAVRNHQKHGLVVMTGGEPLRQNIIPAARQLLLADFRLQIETNGTLFLSGLANLPYAARLSIVCSPKQPVVNPKLWPHVHAVKYVVQDGFVDPHDGLPTTALAGAFPARPPEHIHRSRIFLQPLDEQMAGANARNYKAAVASCMKFGYRLSIQMHKVVGLE